MTSTVVSARTVPPLRMRLSSVAARYVGTACVRALSLGATIGTPEAAIRYCRPYLQLRPFPMAK